MNQNYTKRQEITAATYDKWRTFVGKKWRPRMAEKAKKATAALIQAVVIEELNNPNLPIGSPDFPFDSLINDTDYRWLDAHYQVQSLFLHEPGVLLNPKNWDLDTLSIVIGGFPVPGYSRPKFRLSLLQIRKTGIQWQISTVEKSVRLEKGVCGASDYYNPPHQ